MFVGHAFSVEVCSQHMARHRGPQVVALQHRVGKVHAPEDPGKVDFTDQVGEALEIMSRRCHVARYPVMDVVGVEV